jgi:predicted transcriptional regulator
MVAALKEWEAQVRNHTEDWIHIISRGDAETLWAKLFHIVSRHSAVRSLYTSKDLSWESLKEMYFDLTQDLYVKLQEKDRWQLYLDQGYTHERVEHELYDIEVPNLVSRLLRERHPESYRIARRTSNLLMTRKEFCRYSRSRASSSGEVSARPTNKMVLQVYGLADWPPDKPLKQQQHLHEMIREVAYRMRDTRRAGRGSSSQVVISNVELTQLIIEIFRTINSPADIRTMRSLVLSKLAIEDSQMISMDETMEKSNSETELRILDFPDKQPTPEEMILEKELVRQMELLADCIIDSCRQGVRNKPQRFRKLIEVVWHCYFNHSSSSQTAVAKRMGISDSLVSHYRKIFDTMVRREDLRMDEYVYLNSALDKRVSELFAKYKASDRKQERVKTFLLQATKPGYDAAAKYRLVSGT